MQVVITAAAKLDLFRIGEAIRREAATRVDPFVQALIDHCAQLAEMPRRYPLVPRYEERGIRRCVHGTHLIFYRVRQELELRVKRPSAGDGGCQGARRGGGGGITASA